MADFCRDCTIELAGEEFADRNDFVFDWEPGSIGRVLCEHCGLIYVNRHGQRLPELPDEVSEFMLDETETRWVRV